MELIMSTIKTRMDESGLSVIDGRRSYHIEGFDKPYEVFPHDHGIDDALAIEFLERAAAHNICVAPYVYLKIGNDEPTKQPHLLVDRKGEVDLECYRDKVSGKYRPKLWSSKPSKPWLDPAIIEKDKWLDHIRLGGLFLWRVDSHGERIVLDVDNGDYRHVIEQVGVPIDSIPTRREGGMHMQYAFIGDYASRGRFACGDTEGDYRWNHGVIVWSADAARRTMEAWDVKGKGIITKEQLDSIYMGEDKKGKGQLAYVKRHNDELDEPNIGPLMRDAFRQLVKEHTGSVVEDESVEGKYRCVSPEHEDDNPSMQVWFDKSRFTCNSCGVGGGYSHLCEVVGAPVEHAVMLEYRTMNPKKYPDEAGDVNQKSVPEWEMKAADLFVAMDEYKWVIKDKNEPDKGNWHKFLDHRWQPHHPRNDMYVLLRGLTKPMVYKAESASKLAREPMVLLDEEFDKPGSVIGFPDGMVYDPCHRRNEIGQERRIRQALHARLA